MSTCEAETVGDPLDPLDLLDVRTVKAITRAMGVELRHAREARGWSRGYLAARLPSGIGPRTLLSYEHGTRHLTLLRFIEVCHVLGAGAPRLLTLALQRARVDLDNLALLVDLRALVADNTTEFRMVVLWAHNKLIEHPGGIVEIVPAGVRELAVVAGCPHGDLARYFTRFTPEQEEVAEDEQDGVLVPS